MTFFNNLPRFGAGTVRDGAEPHRVPDPAPDPSQNNAAPSSSGTVTLISTDKRLGILETNIKK
jgi:hypothetical protein